MTRVSGVSATWVVATLALLAGSSLACAESAFAPTRVDGGAGSVTAVAHWQIQTSAKAQESGAEVSSTGFSTAEWLPVSGRATLMAGLLENGKHENLFYGDNLRAARDPDGSSSEIVIPWWYRTRVHHWRGSAGTTDVAAYQRHDPERGCLVEWEPGR